MQGLFEEKEYQVYARINELHLLLLKVLEVGHIELGAKRALAPVLTKVISGIVFKPEEWAGWMERVSNQSNSHGIWVYWEALLEKAVNDHELFEAIKVTHLHTFYLACEILKEVGQPAGPSNALQVHKIIQSIV